MTFTPRPESELLYPPSSLSGSEIAALKKRRCKLLVELAALADQIKMIDYRLHNLMAYEEMGRIGETGKATSEAAAESAKEAGEA